MTHADYSEWASELATILGWNRPEDVQMLRSWYEFFATEDADKLADASRRLIRSNPPRFKSDWLTGLLGALKQMDAQAAEQERLYSASYSESPGGIWCEQCESTGFVTVPSLRKFEGTWKPVAIVAGAARWYTQSVYCDCGLGKYRERRGYVLKEGEQRRDLVLNLDDYEAVNPNWRQQMRARRDAVMREVKAVAHTRAAKGWRDGFDMALDRIRERVAKAKDGEVEG